MKENQRKRTNKNLAEVRLKKQEENKIALSNFKRYEPVMDADWEIRVPLLYAVDALDRNHVAQAFRKLGITTKRDTTEATRNLKIILVSAKDIMPLIRDFEEKYKTGLSIVHKNGISRYKRIIKQILDYVKD